MWIILCISAAFFNALWTALSKRHLGKIPPYHFTIIFRGLTALFLLPVFLYDFKVPTSYIFWLAAIAAGILEVISIYSQSVGVKKDFYSTYSLANTSPLFTLIIASHFLPEKINLLLLFGVLFTVTGGFIFYQLKGKFSIYGIIRALCMSIVGVLSKIAIDYSSGFSFPFIIFSLGVLFMVILIPFNKKLFIDLPKFKSYTKNLSPLALFSTLATLSYYPAVQIGLITRVSPLVRVNLIFGFLLSYFMLKERENFKRKLFAGILILLGAIFISIS